LLAAGALVGGAALVAGCSGAGPSQAEVVPVVTEVTSKEGTATLTPIEKGKLRREILDTAREALGVWMLNDLERMGDFFAEGYVTYYKDQQKKYDQEGVVRVREHESLLFDVVDLTPDGTQAIVKYRFVDRSRFTDRAGRVVRANPVKETEMQLTMTRKGDAWIVERIIAAERVLE